jgi:hypothetical protein
VERLVSLKVVQTVLKMRASDIGENFGASRASHVRCTNTGSASAASRKSSSSPTFARRGVDG